MTSFDVYKQKVMQDPVFRAAYESIKHQEDNTVDTEKLVKMLADRVAMTGDIYMVVNVIGDMTNITVYPYDNNEDD